MAGADPAALLQMAARGAVLDASFEEELFINFGGPGKIERIFLKF